jgi:hypothetical protein
MIPLYAFLRGDTLGLLVLAEESDTMDVLAAKVQIAASVRVPRSRRAVVVFDGRELSPTTTVAGAGITALDRVDVIGEGAP